MQSLIYNNVEIGIIRTNFVNREAIYTEDRATYLYTKWTIDIIGHVVTIETPGNPNANVYPGATENEIRNLLMQPRRQLKVVAGAAEILYSPQRIPTSAGGNGTDVYPCDAKNGPLCSVFAIRQMVGVNMFVVNCRFETHIVEYDKRTQSKKLPNVVLANRFSMIEDIDELHYPTRYVAGEAILRTDLMRQRDIEVRGDSEPGDGLPNFNADSLRENFFFPVPANYQRQNVRVELSTDGSRLNWSFEDVGRCYNLGDESPILKIEVYRTTGARISAPLNAAVGAFRSFGTDWLNAFSTFRRPRYGVGSLLNTTALGCPPTTLWKVGQSDAESM